MAIGVTGNVSILLRIIFGVVLLVCIIGSALVLSVTESKKMIYEAIQSTFSRSQTVETATTPFPISVDPATATITQNDNVLMYLDTYLADEDSKPIRTSWWHNFTHKLVQRSWYQNLASPTSRILVIWPGDRKEQVVDNIGDVMRWDNSQRERFAAAMGQTLVTIDDGYYFPGQYVTSITMVPEDVARLIQDKFTTIVTDRYDASLDEIVPLEDTLTIASLLERESASFEDMREISGVIWNRLFTNMPLQLDATLQYVKGNDSTIATWWPVPRPADKYLESPYNTYINKGLPPGPIANPSAAAILAALNPNQTDCLFYFHHTDRSLHCSENYEEHIEKLKALYGRGQ